MKANKFRRLMLVAIAAISLLNPGCISDGGRRLQISNAKAAADLNLKQMRAASALLSVMTKKDGRRKITVDEGADPEVLAEKYRELHGILARSGAIIVLDIITEQSERATYVFDRRSDQLQRSTTAPKYSGFLIDLQKADPYDNADFKIDFRYIGGKAGINGLLFTVKLSNKAIAFLGWDLIETYGRDDKRTE